MAGPMVKEHTLANGLKLIGEVNSANSSAAVGFFVKTGARDETKSEAGVSHFLEHMMFKGTKKRSAIEITYEMGNLGAQANAYTSEESTVFYGAIIPENFGAFQALLSDMLRPALDPAEFDTEKKVILEEIALYFDRPHYLLYESAARDYYSGHPAGNSVLGSIQSITDLSRDQMQTYFDRRYTAANLVLVASGKFDWDTFVADSERLCGQWPAGMPARQTPPFKTTEMFREYQKKDIYQAHLLLLSDAPSSQEDERYDLNILASILGDSSGSKLYWELVNPGIAESASTDVDEKDGTGSFMLSASCDPKDIDQVSKLARNILSQPLNFTPADVERAKSKIRSRVVLGGELPMGRLMAIGSEWNARRQIISLREIIDRVDRVTTDSIARALDKYPLKNWAEFRLMPEGPHT